MRCELAGAAATLGDAARADRQRPNVSDRSPLWPSVFTIIVFLSLSLSQRFLAQIRTFNCSGRWVMATIRTLRF